MVPTNLEATSESLAGLMGEPLPQEAVCQAAETATRPSVPVPVGFLAKTGLQDSGTRS